MTGFDDYVQDAIAEFASTMDDKRILDEVAKEAKRRVLDSIAVSAASLPFEAVRRVRDAAVDRFGVEYGGSYMWFSPYRLIPEYAGFINSGMTRALDFNDTYLSKEPQHPSDMIGVLYAAGEADYLGGEDLIKAVVAGYEVGIRLCDSASLRRRGWDHVNFTMLGAVAGLSALLGLSYKEAGEALAIAAVPHVALRQTRAGKITMWKAFAAADACRHGMYSTYLAMYGVEGPNRPFTGEMGFINQLGLEFDPNPIKALKEVVEPKAILKSYMKFHPVEYHAQSAVDAVLKIKERFGVESRDIDRVEVGTVQASYDIIVKHPEKWRPENRETADHSLPYIVAYTLVYGDIWLDAYTPEKLVDEEIHRLMSRMDVKVDPELDKRYPEEVPNRVKVYLKDGGVVEETVYRPRGYPGSGDDVDKLLIEKTYRLLRPYYPEDRIEEIINVAMNLEKYDLAELSELLVI